MGPAEQAILGGGRMGWIEKSRTADLFFAGLMDMFREPHTTSRADTKVCKAADEEAISTMSSA
jgi:hypothetical protein